MKTEESPFILVHVAGKKFNKIANRHDDVLLECSIDMRHVGAVACNGTGKADVLMPGGILSTDKSYDEFMLMLFKYNFPSVKLDLPKEGENGASEN